MSWNLPYFNLAKVRKTLRTCLRLVRSLYGDWLPCSGVCADWLSETFEHNLAQIFKRKTFAETEVGDCVRYQNLFRLRVGAETCGQLHCRSKEIVILFYRLACCGADPNPE